ncbi:MAG TPA: hypothetical protein VN408_24315, partial [Actinoplanes sp.]|nr:hypothetical protein [Actinoplanes sp.]
MSAERAPYPAWWRRWAYLQTIPRTVGTEHGAVFILVALAVLAGSSLGDFAIALLIGILVGTY